MSRITINTWADGFGTWHARVKTQGVMPETVKTLAWHAIADEIGQRNNAPELERMSVRLGGEPTAESVEYVESWPVVPEPTAERVMFYREHGGWSYDPRTETAEQGKQRSAYTLAYAESWAKDRGVTFEWSVDPEIDSSDFDTDPEPWALYDCIAYDGAGNVIGSLGGVDFGRDGVPDSAPYAKVVQAELVADHMRYIGK